MTQVTHNLEPPGQGMAIPCGGSGAALPDSKYQPISNSSVGVLLGTAVGDSLGLPAERLTPERISKNGWNQWRQRFFFAQKYFESIDPYLSNVVRVGCSEKIHTFYVFCKSSTRCSSTLLQLYIADNLMNFYRLSIKALRQRNFYNNTSKSRERN